MSKHPRLVRRNGVYYHRAGIPADIRDTYPKSEETFSLRTANFKEALTKLRKAAAEVDARFEEHRRQRQAAPTPLMDNFTPHQLTMIEEAYYAHLLDEDDEVRLEGFYDPDGAVPDLPAPSFEDHVQVADDFGQYARFLEARGGIDEFLQDEIREVLSWDGIGLAVAAGSRAEKLVARSLRRAIIRAQAAKQQRNEGHIVETPTVSVGLPSLGIATKSSAPLASEVRRLLEPRPLGDRSLCQRW